MTRRLPAPIKTRPAEARRHALALKAILDGTTVAEYLAAAKTGSPDALVSTVYPLERAFEILASFVVELAEEGLKLAGIVPESSGAKILRQLETAKVISRNRREQLAAIHGVRNEMQHLYPDIRAQAVYGAAGSLLAELGGFFADYASWLRKLGYG